MVDLEKTKIQKIDDFMGEILYRQDIALSLLLVLTDKVSDTLEDTLGHNADRSIEQNAFAWMWDTYDQVSAISRAATLLSKDVSKLLQEQALLVDEITMEERKNDKN